MFAPRIGDHITAFLNDLFAFYHTPFGINHPRGFPCKEGLYHEAVPVGIAGGDDAQLIKYGGERTLKETVVGKRPDGNPCQLVEVARQKQGLNPGKMVGHENDQSIGDVFFPVNIYVEF